MGLWGAAFKWIEQSFLYLNVIFECVLSYLLMLVVTLTCMHRGHLASKY